MKISLTHSWLLGCSFLVPIEGFLFQSRPIALHRQSTFLEVKKTVYKHLYRHYDDVSFDSWIRCEEPLEFLLSVGYSLEEANQLANQNPQLIEQNVHSHLAPKIRFLVETMDGGTGDLTWEDEGAAMNPVMDDEECSVHETVVESPHSMRVLPEVRKVVPSKYFSCLLDRTLGPYHAYLDLHELPHGPQLLQNNAKLLNELLDAKSSKDFAALCNRWSDTPEPVHTKERIEAFPRTFCPGLLPVASQCGDYSPFENCSPGRMIELQVAHGANHLEHDRHGISPLHWAAGTGNVQGTAALLEAHFHSRPGGNNTDKYADIVLEEQGYKDGATPIHWASCGIQPFEIGFAGSFDVCRLLLKKAGDRRSEVANAKCWSQSTPLMWAAWSGSLPVVDLLGVHGADPHAVNSQGDSAAHWTAAAGHLHVCQYLYDTFGVDFTLEDKNGKTPLFYAIQYDRKNVEDWLARTFYLVDGEASTSLETEFAKDESNVQ